MWKKYKESLSAGVIFIFGIAYLAFTFSIRKYGDAAVDSRFLPQILGVILIILSGIQLITSVKKSAYSTDEEIKQGDVVAQRKVLFTFILMIVYAFLMEPIGFLLMTMVYVFLQVILLTTKEDRNYLLIGFVSIGFSLIVYFVFVKGFSLVLPSGILG